MASLGIFHVALCENGNEFVDQFGKFYERCGVTEDMKELTPALVAIRRRARLRLADVVIRKNS